MWIIGIYVACCIESIELIPFSIHNLFYCHLISLHGRHHHLPTVILCSPQISLLINCYFTMNVSKKLRLKYVTSIDISYDFVYGLTFQRLLLPLNSETRTYQPRSI